MAKQFGIRSIFCMKTWKYSNDKIAFSVGVAVLLMGFILWVLIDSSGNLSRFRPLAAILVYLILCVLLSANPSRVCANLISIRQIIQIKWRPVIGGFILQISFGLFVLRWSFGQLVLRFLSDKVSSTLSPHYFSI